MTIPAGTNFSIRSITAAVPAKAVTGIPLGVRFRLSSGSSPGSTGSGGGSGEVEDYVVTILPPTTDFGDYSRFGSANSTVVSGLRIGATTDTEYVATTNTTATGDDITGLDDEDGVFLSSLTAGATVSVPVQVTNTTGATAYLNAWIDYNNNGILTDAGEHIATNVSIVDGSVNVFENLSFTIPPTAVTGSSLGARFRLTSISSPNPTGASGNGEVEDYQVTIAAPTSDFGDFNNFGEAQNGVSDKLRLGALVDVEYSQKTNGTATGDDLDGSDDEDGVQLPATMTLGETVTIPVTVTNTSDAPVFLNAWIDYNNNGNLSDAGEQIANNITVPKDFSDGLINIVTTIPESAVTDTNLGIRFRLTSSSSPGSTGSLGGNGEVEDYRAVISRPMTDFGDFNGFSNASSLVVPSLRLGALSDAEFSPTSNSAATGDDLTGLDDEDGVTLPAMTAGAPATIPVQVTNTSGGPAYLNAWIDFNRNGSLTDPGEQIATNVNIADGVTGATQNIDINVPTAAVSGLNLGARFRLTSTATPGATGSSGNGEVEDYVTVIAAPPTDFGDWSRVADASSLADDNLRLGDLIDTEFTSNRNSSATGDDITGIDDEDGIILPSFIAGAPATITALVTNTTGASAFLNAWIDYNDDGSFSGPDEQIASNVTVPSDTVNEAVGIHIVVPPTCITGVSTGMRFRLTSNPSPGFVGVAGTGEVEDYTSTIAEPSTDYGDWDGASDASSTISSDLRMGALADGEYTAFRTSDASGDDTTKSDDEDGVILPILTPGKTSTLRVITTNNTGGDAYLNAWIDFNGNGVMDDSGEQIANNLVVSTGIVAVSQNITVNVPVGAIVGQRGARFRLTDLPSPGPIGDFGIGEVEDHLANILGTKDFGDYSSFSSASSTANANLHLGEMVDTEEVATTNTTATGDDSLGIDDEDGVTIPATIISGGSVDATINVTNTTGAAAYLNVWIDFNHNGILTDSGEQIATGVVVADGASNLGIALPFTVPVGTTPGVAGMRVRLTSTSNPGPIGDSGIGEVEDGVVTITTSPIDYGDFAGFGNASSNVVSSLKIGAAVDTEGFASVDATATGDDISNADDEDGVTLPVNLTPGTSSSITVNLTNTSGSSAFLNVWIDYNRNGLLTDSGEQIATNTVIASGVINSNRTINFNVPSGASLGTAGIRVRLTSLSSPGSVGASGNGEVEDYVITIGSAKDYGDWNGAGAMTSTTSSSANINLRMGGTVDAESSVTPNSAASTDDTTGTDDEDGVVLPSSVVQHDYAVLTVTATNGTSAAGYLSAWIDFNRDGSLTGEEQVGYNIAIPSGTLNGTFAIQFSVPINASPGLAGVRVRLSSVSNPPATGAAGAGEIEDYTLNIVSCGGNYVYVGDISGTSGQGLVYRFNASNFVMNPGSGPFINPGLHPDAGKEVEGITAVGNSFIVAQSTNFGSPRMSFYDRTTGAYQGGFSTATLLMDLAPSLDGQYVYGGGTKIRLSDGATMASVPWGPWGVAVQPTFGNVFLTYGWQGSGTAQVKRYDANMGSEVLISGTDGPSGRAYTGITFQDPLNFYVMERTSTSPHDSGQAVVRHFRLTNPLATSATLVRTLSANAGDLPDGYDLSISSDGKLFACSQDGGCLVGWRLSDGLYMGVFVPAAADPTKAKTLFVDCEEVIRSPFGSIGDYVFLDKNSNGTQDAGDTALPNITVNLYRQGDTAPFRTSSTDALGRYTFAMLPPGTYFVEFPIAQSSGLVLAAMNKSGDSATDSDANPLTGRTSDISIVAGQKYVEADAGYVSSYSIGNRVWRETDGNGVYNGGEILVSNAKVQVLDSNNVVISTRFTDTQGNYRFDGLSAGTYTVRLPADNWTGLTGAGALNGTTPMLGLLSTPGVASAGQTSGPSATNNMDHGIDSAFPQTTGISSPPVTLGVGNQPLGEEPKLYSSVGFDGSTTNVSLPSPGWTGDTFTVAMWVKRSGAQYYPAGLFMDRGAGTAGGLAMNASGALTYRWDTSEAFFNSSSVTVADGVWTLVALTVNGGAGATLYAHDGVLQSFTNPVRHVSRTWNGALNIGYDSAAAARRFKGDIDNVRVWNRALTAEEIRDLYFGITPSGTIARWNLDETTGSTAIDSIGTLDGVYTGAVVQGEDPAPDTSYYGGNGFSGDASDNLSIDFAFSEVTQDFGDWNGSGALTTTTSSTKDPNLRLGAVTDAEATVSPNSLATADDLTGVDDEDGVTMPTSIILGSQVVLPVVVSNTTGASAYLHAWIDFNNDGAFDNALISNGGERLELAREIVSGVLDEVQNVTFTVPAGASIGAQRGVRFRITDQAVTAPTGVVGIGEVEDYVVAIACPVVTLNPNSLADATTGLLYTQTVSASGGSGPYTFAVTSGLFPSWASLNASTGVISGTPDSAGSYDFTITATDARGCMGSRAYALNVNCVAIKISPTVLSSSMVGTPWSQPLVAGPNAPLVGVYYSGQNFNTPVLTREDSSINFDWAQGSPHASLPSDKFSVRWDGTILPTTSGSYAFQVTGDDGVRLWVNNVLVINQWKDQSATSYTATVSLTAGTLVPIRLEYYENGGYAVAKLQWSGPAFTMHPITEWTNAVSSNYTWSVASGSLPAGINLNPATGLLSGTPESTLSTSFTIRALDSYGCEGTANYTVAPQPGSDFGDYSLFGSASSKVYSSLKIGATTDVEMSGTSNATATGDDVTGNDDEDGLTLPSSVAINSVSAITLTVTNTSGSSAYLNAWIDFNGNGVPNDAGEQVASNVAVASGVTANVRTINFTVPANAYIGDVGVRVRLSSTANPGVVGASGNGEVEDALLRIVAASDAGDHAGLGTASSTVNTDLRLGALVDGELTDLSNANATGDDLTADDDEDGVTVPAVMAQGSAQTITVNVTNNTSLTAFLNVWIDYNKNGLLTDSGEQIANNITIAPNTVDGTRAINFTVPSSVAPGAAAVRARLTSTSNATSTGASGTGEVEDYVTTISCLALAFNPATLPTGTVGVAYNQSITCSNGKAPISFALESGSLPAGLSFSSGGLLSGTPTSSNGPGSTITVRATDAFGCQSTRNYVLQTCPIVSVGPSTIGNPIVGAPYSAMLIPFGGSAPYTFSIASGSLPTGLNLNVSTGEISGTATRETPVTFTVRVADANGCAGTKSYTVTPVCPIVTLDQTSLNSGAVGVLYDTVLTASGGTAPYTFTVSAGTLPEGLSLSAPGVLRGTPTTGNGGGVSITVTATDANGCQGSQSLNLKICPVIAVSPSTLVQPTVGSGYSRTVTAGGGAAPYVFSITSGNLPNGLALDGNSGVISGVPTSSTSATFTVRATDSNGCIGTRAFTLAPNCPVITVNPNSVGLGTMGTLYSETFGAVGGTGPYTFDLSSGTLPDGLFLDSATGQVSGTPSASNGAGASVTVRATDNYGCQGTRTLLLQICPVVTLSPSTLNVPEVGIPYNSMIAAGPGGGPYEFGIVSGSLPDGLSFEPTTGEISGTAINTTSASFVVSATDANGCSGTRSYTLAPACPVITANPASLVEGTTGTSYSQALTAMGGTAPYSFLIKSGTLPAGISFSAAGALSGTPMEAGSFPLVVEIVDDYGCKGTVAYDLKVNCPVISVTPGTLPSVVQFDAYTTTLIAANGTAPYVWSITAGSLPAGLSLTPSGTLSGTTNVPPSVHNLTLQVVDAYGCSASVDYELVVACNNIVVAPAALPKAYYNTAYSQALSASNGTAPYTWTITAGAPPPGISMSAAGILSGTSTTFGTASFSVRATDANGCFTVADLNITVKGLTIGDLVYDDANFNGVKDAGESGVSGAIVQLWDPGADFVVGGTGADADTQIGSDVTTGADGRYLFEFLPPGRYFVKVTPPTGLPYSGASPVGIDNGIDNDNNAANQPAGRGGDITSPVIFLDESTEPTVDDGDADTDLTLDFGLFAGLRLGNLVWEDTDDDGSRDPGEPGIEGVSVEIWSTGSDGIIGGTDDSFIASIATDSDGVYSFGDLPPENVYVTIPTPPTGHLLASSVVTDASDDDTNKGYQVSAGSVYSGVINLASQASSGIFSTDSIDFGFIPIAEPGVFLTGAHADGIHAFNSNTGMFTGSLVHPFGNGLSRDNGDSGDVPHDMELGPDGNWYVAHPGTGNLRKISANGADLGLALDSATVGITTILHFAIGPDRNYYVVDSTGGRIVRFHGPISTTPGLPMDAAPYTFISQAGIQDLNFGPDGNLYLVVDDGVIREIQRYDSATGLLLNTITTDVQIASTTGGGAVSPQITGIDIFGKTLYGVNATDGEIFSVDLTDPSSPGAPQLVATIASAGAGVVAMKDIEVSPKGTQLFVAGYDWGKPVTAGTYTSGGLVRVGVSGGTVDVFEDPIPEPPGPNRETWSGPQDVMFGRTFAPLLSSVSVGSMIWNDLNANGVQDVSEAGIAGVRVELWRDANDDLSDGAEFLVGWTYSDANGLYYFSGEPSGTYQIRIPTSNFALGGPLADLGLSSPFTKFSDNQVESGRR